LTLLIIIFLLYFGVKNSQQPFLLYLFVSLINIREILVFGEVKKTGSDSVSTSLPDHWLSDSVYFFELMPKLMKSLMSACSGFHQLIPPIL